MGWNCLKAGDIVIDLAGRSRLRGLPMAKTTSPIRDQSESPIQAYDSFAGAVKLAGRIIPRAKLSGTIVMKLKL
jgi:hypothetical protein